MKKVEEEIEYKICTVCSEKKPLTEFHKRKEVKDGHRSICKTCRTEYSRKWYELNHERALEHTNRYYHRNKKKRQEYLHENKDQISKKRKQFYRENKERLSERQKRYYHKNKERICNQKKHYYRENQKEICKRQRKYRQSANGHISAVTRRHRRDSREVASEVSLTTEQFQRILKNQRYRCNMCGKKFTKTRPVTMDHIIPLSKGGGLTSSNAQALCKTCNCKKQARVLKRFIISWTVF